MRIILGIQLRFIHYLYEQRDLKDAFVTKQHLTPYILKPENTTYA